MIYDIFNCNWVAVVHYTFTHKQNTEHHNRHKQYTEQHNSLIRKSEGRAPSLRGTPWHLPYNRGKRKEKRRMIKKIVYSYNYCKCYLGYEVKDKIGMACSIRRDVRNMYIQQCSGNMKARLKYVCIK
jgi:hypothetical protein